MKIHNFLAAPLVVESFRLTALDRALPRLCHRSRYSLQLAVPFPVPLDEAEAGEGLLADDVHQYNGAVDGTQIRPRVQKQPCVGDKRELVALVPSCRTQHATLPRYLTNGAIADTYNL